MTNLEPLWRRMAGELYSAIDKETAALVLGDKYSSYTPLDPAMRNRFTKLIESLLAERLAGVLGTAQDLIEDYRPVAGGGDPGMDVLKAELERLLKGE